MMDLSTLSDAELLALRDKAQKQSIADMSDEDLLTEYNRLLAERRVQSESGWMQTADDAVRSVARGVPLLGGGMDEAAAGLNTGFGNLGNYDQELAYQRARDRQFDEEHPWISTTGQVAGAIGGTLATLPMLPARLFAGATMPRTIAKGAGIGAGLGAEEAFTRGEGGFQERLEGVPASAGLGAFIGFGAPLAARGIGAAWNGIASFLASRGIDRKSISTMLRELQASGMSPQQAQARLEQLGPEGMLADVTPGMQTMTGGTAVADSAAGNTIAQRLATRREGGQGRVAQSLNDAFGPPADPYSVRQGTRAVQRSTGPAYDKTREYAVETGPVADYVQAEIQRVGPRGPLGTVLQQIRGMLTDDAGNLVSGGDRVHAIRQQLDMMTEQARNSGQGKLASELRRIRKGVDKSLKSGVLGLAEADRTYSTAARQQEAYDQGRRNVLRGGTDTMTPAQLGDLMRRSSGSENAMRQQGVRTELDRITGNQRKNPGAMIDRIIDRDWNSQKIAELIGPARARRLAQDLDREATFLETSGLGEPARGSRTAVLGSAQRLWGSGGGPSVIGDVIAAGTAGTAIGGLKAGISAAAAVGGNAARKAVIGKLTRASAALIQETADNLTATGKARDMLIEELTAYAAKLPRQWQTAAAIERAAKGILQANAGRLGYENRNAFASRGAR